MHSRLKRVGHYFRNLLRKVSEAAKGLRNRQIKLAAAEIRAVSKTVADIAAEVTAAAAAASKFVSTDADMAGNEGPDIFSTTTDKSPAEEPTDNRDASISVEAAPVDATRAESIGADHASDDDDSRDISSIAAAAAAENEATRRSTRLAFRLFICLNNVSAAVDSASDAYASGVVLSGPISSNHPLKAVHTQRTSEQLAAIHVQADTVATAIRAVDALDGFIKSSRKAIDDSEHADSVFYDSV